MHGLFAFSISPGRSGRIGRGMKHPISVQLVSHFGAAKSDSFFSGEGLCAVQLGAYGLASHLTGQ